MLTDANVDLAVDPKALPSTAFGLSASSFSVGLTAASPPNGLAPEIDVPRVPNGDVDDWASLLNDDASKAALDVSNPPVCLLACRDANGDAAEALAKPLVAGS
jgi:hypothetical protein